MTSLSCLSCARFPLHHQGVFEKPSCIPIFTSTVIEGKELMCLDWVDGTEQETPEQRARSEWLADNCLGCAFWREMDNGPGRYEQCKTAHRLAWHQATRDDDASIARFAVCGRRRVQRPMTREDIPERLRGERPKPSAFDYQQFGLEVPSGPKPAQLPGLQQGPIRPEPPMCNTEVPILECINGENQEEILAFLHSYAGLCGYSIDYARYSMIPPEKLVTSIAYPHEAFALTTEKVKPLPKYRQAVRLTSAWVNWENVNQQTDKALLEMSGSDCGQAVSLGVDLRHLLWWALEHDASFTRVDFAVDVFKPVNVADIQQAFDTGQMDTFAETGTQTGSSRKGEGSTGQTVYIGAWQSGRFVRVYDKAQEVGLEGHWVRIEIVAKNEWANLLAEAMVREGIIPAGKAFIRSFIPDAGVAWFNEALAGAEGVYLGHLPDKFTDRQKWYRDQVLPAMDDDLHRGDGWLRGALQGVLDETEEFAYPQHLRPGRQPAKLSKKLNHAIIVLRSEWGVSSKIMSWAMRIEGTQWVYDRLAALGYTYDRGGKTWRKTRCKAEVL